MKNILRIARAILEANAVEKIGEGNSRWFFSVQGEGLEVRQERQGLDFVCVCPHCSVMSVHNPFCSRKMALIVWLM
ncbi:hypothetical protein LCGC14_1977010, partial [marine sediment metagenome]